MEKVIYKKSLIAKLVLRRGFSIEVYQGLKDLISTHKDVTTKLTFDQEKVTYGKKNIALIKSYKKNMVIYLNINPTTIAKKYGVTDASKYVIYKEYPTKLLIKNEKDLENAEALLERVLTKAGAKEFVEAPYVDYEKELYERSFGQLYKEGLIRSYIKEVDDDLLEKVTPIKTAAPTEAEENPNELEMDVEDDDDDELDLVKVVFNASLDGADAKELYVISNYVDWNPDKAIKMDLENGQFTLTEFYPRGFDLQFKITSNPGWEGVEKGMFGEEIENHTYTLDKDIEVEDIIHNFRED
ncbi:MAG: hypothetical protein K6A63_02070 [Acholeplasmatales bacterium]|nr:hypothetical protein [Acholeplasmatales bacterium]